MEWQLIDSAPRDGERILLHEAGISVPVVGYWVWAGDHDLMQGYWEADVTFYMAKHADVEDLIDTSKVTHWIPLPVPPT